MRYSVGSGLGPRCNSPYIRTCCGMAAAMPSPTPATTHGRYRLGSATRTSSTRCAIPSWRRIDLRTSGDENFSSRCRLEPAPYGLNRNACDHVGAAGYDLYVFAPPGSRTLDTEPL